ncbi:MAG TPA: DUF2924 domain-containing protein [Allosphingosinicella sp.]|jgi:hypothetical protein
MRPTLSDELAALATMSSAQLRAEWLRVFGAPAPHFSSALLELGLAYELQAKRHGRLPAATRREIDRLRKQLRQSGKATAPAETSLKPGTRLSRDWHGRTYHVLVEEDGFELDGRRYRSLTQIANVITGGRWSGPRFFGLTSKAAQEQMR